MTIEQQEAGARKYATLQARRESLSGPGSYIANTGAVAAKIAEWVKTLGVTSIVDVPCGDHNWMSRVELPCVEYLGIDLLPEVVVAARQRRPDRQFWVGNAIKNAIPRADLVICRDLLVHLSFEHGVAVLNNIRQSGSTWLATTSFPELGWNEELAESHKGWGWRPVNVECLPYAVGLAHDSVEEDEGKSKRLCLYRL